MVSSDIKPENKLENKPENENPLNLVYTDLVDDKTKSEAIYRATRLAHENDINFTNLAKIIDIWASYNFGILRNPQDRLIGIGEEFGELCHATLKESQNIRGTPEEHRLHAQDAIGDMLIYIADYCAIRKFDLQDIMNSVVRKVVQRD